MKNLILVLMLMLVGSSLAQNTNYLTQTSQSSGLDLVYYATGTMTDSTTTQGNYYTPWISVANLKMNTTYWPVTFAVQISGGATGTVKAVVEGSFMYGTSYSLPVQVDTTGTFTSSATTGAIKGKATQLSATNAGFHPDYIRLKIYGNSGNRKANVIKAWVKIPQIPK